MDFFVQGPDKVTIPKMVKIREKYITIIVGTKAYPACRLLSGPCVTS